MGQSANQPTRNAVLELCAVPIGWARAVQYSVRPRSKTRSSIPRLPFRPPDNYLRETMAATLAKQEVNFDFMVQVPTDP
jgi:hypothetical protein